MATKTTKVSDQNKSRTSKEKIRATSRELMSIGVKMALSSIPLSKILGANVPIKDADVVVEPKTCLMCGVKFDSKAAFCSAECMKAAKAKQRKEREARNGSSNLS